MASRPVQPWSRAVQVGEQPRLVWRVHELLEIFPVNPDEQIALTADIAASGQRVPAVLDASGVTLIDGRMRLTACAELGIAPQFTRLPAMDELGVAMAVVTLNVRRRHLSVGMRAMAAVKVEAWLSDALRKRRTDSSNVLQGKRPREVAAEWFGVGQTSVQQARSLTNAMEQARHLTDVAPRLAEEVRAGRMSLNAAWRQWQSLRPGRGMKRPSYSRAVSVAPISDQLMTAGRGSATALAAAEHAALEAGSDLARIDPDTRRLIGLAFRDVGERWLALAARVDPVGIERPVQIEQARRRRQLIRLDDA